METIFKCFNYISETFHSLINKIQLSEKKEIKRDVSKAYSFPVIHTNLLSSRTYPVYEFRCYTCHNVISEELYRYQDHNFCCESCKKIYIISNIV
jgi:DNA-directed RNA polymerase subunit N (RpoN/RPB10)